MILSLSISLFKKKELFQKGIVSAIVEKGADYLTAVKGNRGNLQEQVQDSFRFLPVVSSSEDTGCWHGRIETRRCLAVNDLSLIENREEWTNLRSLVKIETERYDKCRQTTLKETRLYISSSGADAVLINKSLHWMSDVAFGEDHGRKRAGNAAQNFSRLNRTALNLLKNDWSAKVGVKGKRLKAGWDNEYLLKILKN